MSAGGQEIRVLHVDDEPAFADVAARFLEREDDRFSVETAESVGAGLEKLEDRPYHCVVSDYDVLEQTGIEFLRAVRDRYPELPFILFTGKGSEEVASEAISAGVTEYLQKESGTSQYEVLANRIRNAVEHVRTQREASRTQERLEVLAEQTDDILWMYTADWEDLLFINSAYEEIWGRPLEELREFPPAFQRGVHPDDRELTREAMDRLSAGDSIDIEFRVNAEENYGRWIWVQGYPIYEDGEVTRVTGFARDITERKEREERLQRERTQIELALEVTDSYVFEIDFETGEEERFGNWQSIHEVSEETIPDTESFIEEAVHPDDAHLFREKYDELELEPGNFIEFEYRTRPSKGAVRWLRSRVQVLDSQNRDGLIGIGLTTDITALKNREQEIERLNDRYETILANIHETVLLTDHEGQFTYVCPNVEFILGYTQDEVADIGSIQQLFGEGTMAAADAPVFEETENLETVVTDSDGAEHDVLVSIRSVSIGEGRWLYTIRDITGRKHRERLFEQILETSPVGIAVVEKNGEISLANERAEEILGLERSEITDRTYDDPDWVITDDAGDPIHVEDHPVNHVLKTGEEVVGFKHWIELPDGSQRWLSSNSAPILGTDGQVERVVVGLEDITDAKESEQAARKKVEDLDQFAGIVSHDLRNPLSVAEGNLELAMEDHESEYLDRAAAAISRSQALIDDVLALARQGETLGEIESVEIRALVDDCWNEMPASTGTLRVETEREVQGDRSRLRQVFENLLWNAVQHGGEDVTVTVGDCDSGIYIADTGQGIPEAVIDEVFEPGVTSDEAGTGLGLAIVEKFVNAHGWDIRVAGSSATGTRFEITGMTDS